MSDEVDRLMYVSALSPSLLLSFALFSSLTLYIHGNSAEFWLYAFIIWMNYSTDKTEPETCFAK